MNSFKKTSISDLPYNEEYNDFGTDRYVNGLVKFIDNSSAPITIALQGEWGSGKTSLMTRLENSLCNGKVSHFIGININTWEYSMLSTPEETVYKILAQLVQELSQDDPNTKKTFKKYIHGLGGAKGILYRGAREGLKNVPVVGPAAAILLEAANAPTQYPDNSDDKDSHKDVSLADLKSNLETTIKQTLNAKHKSGIIVFVDDLDRLNPPVAVEILELLKNIFTLDNCIFVLAIDYDVVVKGLEPKFGKLTDKNEREFRSFFDKIIQVPFSLPVSSYKPMDFVLSSLVRIGYITELQKGDKEFKDPLEKIVNYSVGKNPRSIKRLINTLSLLSCISSCGNDTENSFADSPAGQIATLAIVALQVCYPKIYKMISLMPNFTKWDIEICERMNIHLPNNEEMGSDWEEILEAACSTDTYLLQRHSDIRELLNLTYNTIVAKNQADDSEFEKKIRSIIDKSSVTGLNEPIAPSEVNWKRLMNSLHTLVPQKIRDKRPDICNIGLKRNTGNGGFFVHYDNNPGLSYLEVIMRLQVDPGKIKCNIILGTTAPRPERLKDKSFEEIMADSVIGDAFRKFDEKVSPLLRRYYFNGTSYSDSDIEKCFNSFSEEEGYRIKQGLQPNLLSHNVTYSIDLPKEELFSDKAVIEAIADVIIAAYDWRKATHSF